MSNPNDSRRVLGLIVMAAGLMCLFLAAGNLGQACWRNWPRLQAATSPEVLSQISHEVAIHVFGVLASTALAVFGGFMVRPDGSD